MQLKHLSKLMLHSLLNCDVEQILENDALIVIQAVCSGVQP